MTLCEHLRELEDHLKMQGAKETFRGAAWSKNCREWVYFDCVLNLEELREKLQLPAFIKSHEHRGTHDGSEKGFICTKCNDGVMGKLK